MILDGNVVAEKTLAEVRAGVARMRERTASPPRWRSSSSATIPLPPSTSGTRRRWPRGRHQSPVTCTPTASGARPCWPDRPAERHPVIHHPPSFRAQGIDEAEVMPDLPLQGRGRILRAWAAAGRIAHGCRARGRCLSIPTTTGQLEGAEVGCRSLAHRRTPLAQMLLPATHRHHVPRARSTSPPHAARRRAVAPSGGPA